MEIKRGRGSIGIERHFEADQHPLSQARAKELAEIAGDSSFDLPVIVAEVQDDRSVLIGPTQSKA